MSTAKLILPANADGTDEWKEQRTKGIGGTDMANLHLGHVSVADVVRDKLGLSEPEQFDQATLDMFSHGHAMEPTLRKAAAERFGVKVRNTGTWARKDRPEFLANPDALVGSDGLLEIKTTGGYAHAVTDWRAGRVPDRAWVQAHWYAVVTGRKRLFFIAEVDRAVIHLGPYDADEALMAELEKLAGTVWEHVTAGTVPENETKQANPVAYVPPADGSDLVIEPWDDTTAVIEKLRVTKAELKRLSEEQKALEAQIKDRMGDATTLRDIDGNPLATWSYSTRRSLDKKALAAAGVVVGDYEKETNVRTFRLKEAA